MSEVSSVRQMTIEEIINKNSAGNSTREVSNELGKDAFLKLLITQLQYQNPLEPMDDQDFIAQIAQFSALEQMQNLNHSFSYSMGFSLLGKYISSVVADEDTGKVSYVAGEVKSVYSRYGKIYLVVDDYDVPLDSITEVSEKPKDYSRMEIEKYNTMLGMLSTVNVVMSEGEELYSIEGIVAKIEKGSDGIYATLDEVILSVTDIDKGAFESAEEYIKGMKGQFVSFKAKDALTEQKIKLEGVLRDGVKDEEMGCYHVILDNVRVPLEDIVSTQKVDLVSTEQQLLKQILDTLKSVEGKLSKVLPETGDTGEENGSPEETTGNTDESELPEEAGETGGSGQ